MLKRAVNSVARSQEHTECAQSRRYTAESAEVLLSRT